jgi:pimeloyl-ACP methyl ester carboxylesterase
VVVTLRDFGSFHVGGRTVTVQGQPVQQLRFTRDMPAVAHDPNGEYLIEPCYVQYFIPEPTVAARPLVLLHGGGLTGVTWETTPDGRPGWLNRFVEFGVPTYVIDTVERGRAGWCALPDIWDGAPVMRAAQQAWTLFRFGPADGFADRQPFPGQRFPVAHLAQFQKQFVPRWLTTGDVQYAALLAALERIGPCTLLCHSQGGEAGFRAALQRPDLVRALVTIESSSYPAAVTGGTLDGQRHLIVFGDFVDEHPTWHTLRQRAQDCQPALTAAGAAADFWSLPEHGQHGNSHMLMMDDNSDALAAMLRDWLLAA